MSDTPAVAQPVPVKSGAHRTRVLAGTLLLLASLSAWGSHSVAAAGASPGRYLDPVFRQVMVTRDVTYGQVVRADGTVELLKLDLYQPAGDTLTSRPVLIFLHGGTASGVRALQRNQDIPRGFAHRGWVGASIDYRSGSSPSSEQTDDLQAGVRWFKANAATYRVDPESIVLMGSSAGAMTSLSAHFNPEDPGNSGNPGYSSEVAGTISVGGTATEHWNIGANEAPIAMVHAADDHTVPFAAAQATCEETRAWGNVCDMYRYETGGHPPVFLEKNRALVTEQSSQFICRNVLGPVVCHDRDSDGIANSRDGCPSLAGGTVNGCPNVTRTVELGYSNARSVFTGAVSSASAACERSQEVVLRRRVPGADRVVGRDVTDVAGRYVIAGKGRPGAYYATVRPMTIRSAGNCLRAESPTLTIE